jgi:hypothetical protein
MAVAAYIFGLLMGGALGFLFGYHYCFNHFRVWDFRSWERHKK